MRAGLAPALGSWLLLVPICVLGARQGACGEDPPSSTRLRSSKSAEPGGRAAPAGQPGPHQKQFDRLLAEWKDLLAKLGILQVRYRRANGREQAEIRNKWDSLVERGDTLQAQLIEAAEHAYLEAPGADQRVTELLVDVLLGHVQTRVLGPRPRRFVQLQTDNFEEARRLAGLLIDTGCPDKRIYLAAGIAAFALQELDDAEKYLKTAQQGNVPVRSGRNPLDELLQDFLGNPARYRKAWAKERKIRQAEAKADDLPRVLLRTSQGRMVLELFENQAPNTVANFVSLVEKGFYDGLTFHRVLPGFMAQGGCPIGDGTGGPGYHIPCECYPPHDYRRHFRGSLSMAHQRARDTGGSQFLLTFVPTSNLDGRHTVFGRVIQGFDVLHKLQRRDPEQPNPPEPDKILEATVLGKRDHPYVPTTLPER